MPARAACILVLALLAVLAACGRTGTGPHAPLLVYPTGGPCLAELRARQVDFSIDHLQAGHGGRCSVDTPIRLNASSVALNRPVRVGCSIALALNVFERESLQPAAQYHFGQHVRKIHHYGGFVCRNIAGSNRISQHALGRAIDIAAFELADGRIINVQRDWSGARQRSAFLRDVARGACQSFNMVLSPATDAAHHDHLHFDIGPWRRCSV